MKIDLDQDPVLKIFSIARSRENILKASTVKNGIILKRIINQMN